MLRHAKWVVVLISLGWQAASSPARAELPADLSARHVAGQTFLTWKEVPGEKLSYNIYQRLGRPIRDLSGALRIATVGPDSGVDATATRLTGKRNEAKTILYYTVPPNQSLGKDDGLFVWTASQEASAYYAVTAVRGGQEDATVQLGRNSLTSPVSEKVGLPEPVLQGRAALPFIPGGVDRYAFWPPGHDTPRLPAMRPSDSQAISFVVRGVRPDRKDQPFLLSLPGIGGGWWELARVRAAAVVLHVGEVTHAHGYYFGNHDLRYKRVRPEQYPADSVIQNYTQRLLIYLVRWAKRALPIDPNRVSVWGNSMGGIGTGNLVFDYPDEFAAAFLRIPRLYEGDPRWIKETKEVVILPPGNCFVSAWGPFERNFPTSAIGGKYPDFRALGDGLPIYDRTNQVLLAEKYVDVDLPPLTILAGKRDWTVGWTDKPPFIRAMESSRHNLVLYWTTGQRDRGHNTSTRNTPWENLDSPDRLIRYRLNQSYPAINHLAINDDPGEGLDMVRPDMKVTGEPTGTINGYVDWDVESIVDTEAEWRVTLRILDLVDQFADTRGTQETTASVTPRRLQAFQVKPGMRLRWRVLASESGKVLAPESQAVADKYGLVTLKGVKITRAGSTVILRRAE